MHIKNVQEYITIIERLTSKYTYSTDGIFKDVIKPNFLYRGHGNHEKYQLEPLIRRKAVTQSGECTKYSQLEYNILVDFISEAICYENNISQTNLQAWLEMAQHYGVPTRLMDLTENPLIALYFACRSKSDTEASVWIINEREYKKKFYGQNLLELTIDSEEIVNTIITREIACLGKADYNNLPEYKYPWIYKPLYRKERMKLQSSKFMIWGSFGCPLTKMVDEQDYMNLDDNEDTEQRGILCAIKILPEFKVEILRQLNMIGINEKFIYPGIEGVGKTIEKKYSGT